MELSKGALYYQPVSVDPYTLEVMSLIDVEYTKTPFYGSRKITKQLNGLGHPVNRKRVQRLMRLMGLAAICPGPNLSKRRQEHKIYPYLLRGVEITRPNHVWSTDITFIRLREGYAYLMAIIDWYSRYVLAWRLSNSLDASFCVEGLEETLRRGKPEIFNVDQGCQFTSEDFLNPLKKKGVQISMDGKGRALDNIFVERLWRTVKYEEVYLKDYQTMIDASESLRQYFIFYNRVRIHQALDYKTPFSVYGDQERWI